MMPGSDDEARAQTEAEAKSDEAAQALHAEATQGLDSPGPESRILGVNKRHYPMQGECCELRHAPMLQPSHLIHDGDSWCDDPPPTLVVLVQGGPYYAAYCGHGTPEWVRDHGDKISFQEACCHFPGAPLKRELYRD